MLTNYGGHLLSPLRLVVIAAANDSLRDSLFAFAKALPNSQWWPTVATPYGVSPTVTAFTVAGPPIAAGTQMTMADIDAYVQAAAIDSAGYAADGRTAFAIFLPAGVSCTAPYCAPPSGAFHVAFGQFNGLAVLVRFQGETLQTMTVAASHEIIESATDPVGTGWVLKSATPPWTGSPWAIWLGASSQEAADLCEGTRYLDGGFYYQRVFSNQAAALGGDPCIPAIPTPYFNVTTKGWYSTTTGDVSVPMTAWSVGPVADWVIAVGAITESSSSLPSPTFSTSCPDTVLANGIRYCGVNNGKTATLHVQLPASAPRSSYFSFTVSSFRIDANGRLLTGPGEDASHQWTFGVYVP
jgi:hypothetical protein